MLDLTANDDAASMLARIQVLSRVLWEDQGTLPDVERWLANFTGATGTRTADEEQLHALHLLSHFTFFGLREVRELLKSMYRDLFRYHLIQEIRQRANGRSEAEFLEEQFNLKLARTRFLGIGNPSESGAHLLYFFRQENRLKKELFVHQHELLTAAAGDPSARVADPELERIVFIDDVLGTGTQATEYSEKLISHVRQAAERDGREIEILYLTIFAKPDGLRVVRALPFDRVDAVHELNDSQLAFSATSHVYADPPQSISKEIGRSIAEFYGASVAPGNAFGFGDGELLLGLHHNIPDNTLPVFWVEEAVVPWEPIFRRYIKEGV